MCRGVDVCVSQGPPPHGGRCRRDPRRDRVPWPAGRRRGDRDTPTSKSPPQIYVSLRGPKQLVESTLGGAGGGGAGKKYK